MSLGFKGCIGSASDGSRIRFGRLFVGKQKYRTHCLGGAFFNAKTLWGSHAYAPFYDRRSLGRSSVKMRGVGAAAQPAAAAHGSAVGAVLRTARRRSHPLIFTEPLPSDRRS